MQSSSDNHVNNKTAFPGNPHTFHIPVMGTGFSIDTPLRVAKYGISSVISIGDHIHIEQMRKLHSQNNNVPFEPINNSEEDVHARRITAYLNLLDLLIDKQFKELRETPFEEGSDITRYFEMLPETALKRSYREMLANEDPDSRKHMQDELRKQISPGSIDVNIMSKIDQDKYKNGVKLPREFTIAMSALRGYASSNLCSSIVFSAGMNRRLYGYMSQFEDFFPDSNGIIKKKIVLKVSDYRSAIMQGKLLAKLGLWVSEYRIESGLNCGGHAFATKGFMLGPILEEFKQKKAEFIEELHGYYNSAISKLGHSRTETPNNVRITVQGGIGTSTENLFLMKYYQADGTGWGTPFLLVPEVTNVDDAHLTRLARAQESDVHLSENSPLGVPLWNLRTSASENARRKRIEEGHPGSKCPKGYLAINQEFTKNPICLASRTYQKLKLEELAGQNLSPQQFESTKKTIVAKACICHDLAGGSLLKNSLSTKANPAICCGPNIGNFSEITSLEKMIDHIYGRLSLLTNPDRPHMFIKELRLYIDYLKSEAEKTSQGMVNRTSKYFSEFRENLNNGIEYYRNLSNNFNKEQRDSFLRDLDNLWEEIESFFSGLELAVST